MKKNTLFLHLLFFIFINQYAQSKYELYVAFNEKIQNTEIQNLKRKLIEIETDAKQVFDEFQFEFSKALNLSEKKFDYLSKQAQKFKNKDNSIQNLNRIFKIKGNLNELTALKTKLEKWNSVRYCEWANNTPIPPPYDIAPTTANYTSNQTYIYANPGVNLVYAWNKGYNGQNIRFRNVEYGFNKDHEEFNDTNIFIAQGMTLNDTLYFNNYKNYIHHGTATMGQVFAHNSTYGITGMAHGLSEVILYPEWTNENYYNRVLAVTKAIEASVEGDIIMFEMQSWGISNGNPYTSTDFVPAEYNNVIWDLTKAATDAGIIIVAAAGNGNQNLDSPDYADYMARGDSGAIIVGAGTANSSHNRKSFSTYGTRVNMQGWGEEVFTTGYTTLSSLNNDFNQTYTSGFSGTSAATPIVASCAAVLQSYYYGLTGVYLSPLKMRNILLITGIPQGTDVAGNIGPLPDIQNAMNYIDTMLADEEFKQTSVKIFPNPTCDKIYIVQNEPTFLNKIFIYNTLGQIVLQTQNQNFIDVSNLKNGIYFISFGQNQSSINLKFIKK